MHQFCGALGSVEDATWDPADWTRLISEDFGVGPSTNHGSSFDRLPPPGNPVEYFEISEERMEKMKRQSRDWISRMMKMNNKPNLCKDIG